MVRCLGMLLLLAVLLCGCGQTGQPSTPADAPTLPPASAPAGIYVPESNMEQATGGAVRAFALEGEYYDCTMLGEELVLLGKDGENGFFSLYSGDTLQQVRFVQLGEGVAPELAHLQINEQGIGYFDSKNQAVVFLNRDFVETGRMYLPKELQGDAWVTPDWQKVYYCTDKGISCMDLQTGISRLLREQNAFSQKITGCFGNGDVLRYELELTEGQIQIQLIDGSKGVVLKEGDRFAQLESQKEQYYLPYEERGVRKLRFGDGDAHQILWPTEISAQSIMLFGNAAMVMVQQEEIQATFTYYDLESGARYAAITLPGVTRVWGVQGNGKNGVWMFAEDENETAQLYFWDCTKSLTEDTAVYTEPRYTPDAPDTEGLAQVAQAAADLGSRFGVDILVGEAAAEASLADQFFTQEYITHIYTHYLTRLEEALSVFPEGFFTQGDKLQIALVREIRGEPAWGTLAQSDCVQFWKDKVPVVAVTLNPDFQRNLYHGIYLYMETRILSKSSALYEWNVLNPSGFAYDNSYITNLDRQDHAYVEGDSRYFIDIFSMSYAKEDRARIFEYACMPDNADCFQSPVLQEKLRRICSGIRTAYGLKKVETAFLWEQYLT